jgi:hypothetical protein
MRTTTSTTTNDDETQINHKLQAFKEANNPQRRIANADNY